MIRIVVFGISGVGKTRACRAYVAQNPEFWHVTASELISKDTGATLQELMRSDAAEILRNQLVLKVALESELQKRRATKVIIDGQCVLDNGREIVILPLDLIATLQPSGFILLEGQPNEILRRRMIDSRERPFRTAEEISAQIKMNRVAAGSYAAALNVPLVIAEVSDSFNLESPIAQLGLPM